VTNQRVVIVSGPFGRSIQSLDLGSLPGLSLDEGSDWPTGRGRYAPCFDSIADARRVYELIRRTQRDARCPVTYAALKS
jgi:hypothetical protein